MKIIKFNSKGELHIHIALMIVLVGAVSFVGLKTLRASDASTPAYQWTWSSATHPAGAINIGGSTGGGGVYLYHNFYYIPAIAHVFTTPGADVWETPNRSGGANDPAGDGYYGHVAYTTYPNTKYAEPQAALVGTGTKPLAPYVMVSHSWQNAPIDSYANGNGDEPKGSWACITGYSWQTSQANSGQGYRCGQLDSNCTSSSVVCSITSSNGIVSSGDSGGLIWWYSGKGVKILGWEDAAYTGFPGDKAADGSYTRGQFLPVWSVAHHNWAANESWAAGGFTPGNDKSGCFLTATHGCQVIN